MPVPPEHIGVATLALTQAVGAFNAFLPPLTEVRRANPHDSAAAMDVRLGEIASASLAIGIGVVFSSLSGSVAPAFVALIGSIGLVMLYETALQTRLEKKA